MTISAGRSKLAVTYVIALCEVLRSNPTVAAVFIVKASAIYP